MAAPASKRALWKGAISFGLVHIPVALHSATESSGLDFDWLDKRSMDPVGYKRINKKTGKEITSENIVKGFEYEKGNYVILSPEEIANAFPKTTQTIEIETFVEEGEIPFVFMERPYYVAPVNKGEKVYALLREVLRKSGRVGIARVVIATKQHLALLFPSGPALVLNLLRWGDEVRSMDELNLPAGTAKGAGLSDREMKMGEQLVEEMTTKFNPDEFTDRFREQILKLVDEKVKAGDTEEVEPLEHLEEGTTSGSAKIYDLTELLQQSLGGRGKGKAKAAADDEEEEAKDLPHKRAAASKAPHKATAKAEPKKAPAKKAPAKKAAVKKSAVKKAAAKSATHAASKPAARRKAG